MNFSDVFIDALRYPFTDIKKLLTIFILLLGSFLIVPGIIIFGYSLRVIEHTLQGSNKMPDFNDVGDLLKNGIKVVGVSVIYGIPTLALMLLLFPQKLSLLGMNSSIWPNLVLLAVGFLVNIVLTIAIVNMVYEKRFTAAFAFGRIFEIIDQIGWKKYLTYMVVFTVIGQGLSILIKLVSMIPVGNDLLLLKSWIILIVFYSYLVLFTSRFRGLIYPNKL